MKHLGWKTRWDFHGLEPLTYGCQYKDFEERFNLIETKKSALEIVREATYIKIGKFTKQDIKELCPSLSISSIEGSLRKLIVLGEIKRVGQGKNICYYRVK